MRIIILRSNPVDPDSRVEKETESLMLAGHTVTILGWDRDDTYTIKKGSIHNSAGTAEVFRFGIKAGFGEGKKNIIALITFQKRICGWLIKNRNKYDTIHACDLDTGLFSFFIAKATKKLFVYDIFDYYSACRPLPKLLKGIIKKVENSIISHADATIICSEKRKEQIKGSKPKHLTVIHNSPYMKLMDEKGNNPIQISDNNRIRIGYVGILGNTQRMLDEIAYAISEKKDVEYHVGGFGQLEEFFMDMAEKHDNIFYYGKLPYSSTLALEEQMDILTAIYDPSISNNRYAAPNKFYEALMLGKPLIMVHNTGMDEVVDENNLGVTIDYSIPSFCDGLNRLIAMREQWSDIGEREKELFRDYYSWDIMGKRLSDLYAKLDTSCSKERNMKK